jgi:hypothetical protein
MEKQKKDIINFLYEIFNSKKNGVQSHEIDKKIEKAIEMLAFYYDVTVEDIKDLLVVGQKIEMEHTLKDEQFQKIIALQHLVEKLDYYTGSKPKNWAEKELNDEEK